MRDIVQALKVEKVKGERKVFDIGTMGHNFYIVLQGKVNILIPIQSQNHPGKRSNNL
jgi:hypothetical protein